MVSTTRTLNPLPFGDLEPKRFEDLVRQLAYEFKYWRRLEATGRSGSDDGFDARGYEIVETGAAARQFEIEGGDEDETDGGNVDRLWLIQCKREKRIGPRKLRGYLTEIALTKDEVLFGIVFAAASDFSKQSREVLATWCRENGLSEWHIWGRGELEDMLFQPKFDHLLFAYFGISLSIRHRSKASDLRHEIAIKRKLKRFLEGQNDGLVLLRDIDDRTYPDPPEGERPRFRVRRAVSLTAYGLELKVSAREAWLSAKNDEWDAALASWGNCYSNDDPWNQPSQAEESINSLAQDAWGELPLHEKGWLYVYAVIPYRNILLIDDIGDDEFSGLHLFVTGWDDGYQITKTYIETIDYKNRRKLKVQNEFEGRIVKFPEITRPIMRVRWGY